MASEFHCYKARLAERPDSAFHPPKASQTGCDHNFGKAVKVKVYHRFTTWPKICFLVASATRKKTLSKWVQGATATGTLSDAQGFRRQMDGK